MKWLLLFLLAIAVSGGVRFIIRPAWERYRLVQRLNSCDAGERFRALRSVKPEHTISSTVVREIAARLHDSYVPNALVACDLLGIIGERANPMIPALIEELKSGRSQLRAPAANALGRLKAHSPEALAALQSALHAESGFLRVHAALALWQIQGDAESVLPVLIECLSDQDEDARCLSAETLGQMGTAARTAIPHLQEATKEAGLVHSLALNAIKKIDPQ